MAAVGLFETRVSYADLEQAPEDGRRYELYDGEVRVVPSPLPRHQVVAIDLLQVLLDYTRRAGGLVLLAPLDIVFTDYDVLQPDLVYFAPQRRHLVEPDRPIRSAPDLVIEILSPSTERVDRGRKMEAYARFGVPEYWMVDPVAHTIEVHRLAGGRFELTHKAGEADVVRAATIEGLEFAAASAFRA